MMDRVALLTIALLCPMIIYAKAPTCKSSACVGVEIYYESLCIDSINFMKYKFKSAYRDLQDHLDVTFIPWGKASYKIDNVTGKHTFECQHRNPECLMNKAQACAIDAIQKHETPEKQNQVIANFVICVMSKISSSTPIQTCSRRLQLTETTKSKIANCNQSPEGDKLLAAHGDKTNSLEPRLSFVPTIVINGKYSIRNQNDSLENFKRVICNNLPTEGKPKTCSG